MKQVLSVADFATIMRIVDHNIMRFETKPSKNPFKEYKKGEYEKELKEYEEYLKTNQDYQNLKHLKESLQNLNIEVECPDVEIKGE